MRPSESRLTLLSAALLAAMLVAGAAALAVVRGATSPPVRTVTLRRAPQLGIRLTQPSRQEAASADWSIVERSRDADTLEVALAVGPDGRVLWVFSERPRPLLCWGVSEVCAFSAERDPATAAQLPWPWCLPCSPEQERAFFDSHPALLREPDPSAFTVLFLDAQTGGLVAGLIGE